MLPVRGDFDKPWLRRAAGRRSWLPLAAWCLAAGCASSLNPSFLANLGISPINSLGSQPGSIVVVLINRTAFPAELQVRLFEAEGFQAVSRLEAAGNEFFAIAVDCEISQIAFESLTVTTTDDTGATSEEDVDVPATPLISGINFTCGRVIVATVSGTAQNFELNTRVE